MNNNFKYIFSLLLYVLATGLFADQVDNCETPCSSSSDETVTFTIPAGEEENYQRQLAENMIDVKRIVDQNSDPFLSIMGGMQFGQKYAFEDNIELAFGRKDYTAVSKLLTDASLMISHDNSVISQLVIHPYQPRNSAVALIEALLKDETDRFQSELEKQDGSIDEYVYVAGAYEETALEVAIRKQNNDAVTRLLEKGADPKASKNGPWATLTRSVYYKNHDVLYQLLDHGVHIDQQLSYPGNIPTLMSYAVTIEDFELLNNLIARNADANIGDSYGWTPLMDAIHQQNLELVELLLPLSDPTILSAKPITGKYHEKGFKQTYPRCNALYVAEQIDSPLGAKIVAAVKSRIEELGKTIATPESMIADLDALQSRIQYLMNAYKIDEGLVELEKGLTLLKPMPLSADSDARFVKHAIWFILQKHEMLVMNNDNLQDEDREFANTLFSLGSTTEKWHDMLDVFHDATDAFPHDQLDVWQETHGKPSRKGWNFSHITEWIETHEDTVVRDRLYDTLDFFELN